jgi:ribosomal protein S12 methylthiotransferase accessory factor YcaO
MAQAGAQPDPNAVFLQAAAEEALAKAAQARAGVVKTVADSELARAKTLETVSKIDMDQTRMAMDAVKMIGLPEQTPPRPEL